MYMKIDGIKGDATDEKFKDQIEVYSFGHSIHQPTGGPQTSAGGHTGGRVNHDEFTITKKLDTASPMLFLACCTGEPIKNAVLTLRKAAAGQKTFMTYTFETLIVASVSPTGSSGGDSLPQETVTLRYDKVTLEYTPISSDGKEGAKIKGGWDIAKNKKV